MHNKFVIIDFLSIEFSLDGIMRKSDEKGLEVSASELVQVAAVKVENGKIVKNFTTFIAPDWIDVDNICSHWEPDNFGITLDHLKGAPDAQSVIKQLISFAGDSIIIPSTVNSSFEWRKFKTRALACGYVFNNITIEMSNLILAKQTIQLLSAHKNLDTLTALGMANYLGNRKNTSEIMEEYGIDYPPYWDTDRMVVRDDCLSRAIASARLFIAMAGDEIVLLKEVEEGNSSCPF